MTPCDTYDVTCVSKNHFYTDKKREARQNSQEFACFLTESYKLTLEL